MLYVKDGKTYRPATDDEVHQAMRRIAEAERARKDEVRRLAQARLAEIQRLAEIARKQRMAEFPWERLYAR